MARSYGSTRHFKTSHPFRSAPPYQRVGAEAELSDEYARLLGRDPRPELGRYEGTLIPPVRRKAIPPQDMDEQFKLGRPPSSRMLQRRTAKKSTHRKLNPYMVTTGGQAVPQFKRQDLSTFAASGKSVQRHEEEQGQQFRITNTRPGLWEIVDARTGQPTGKYAGSAERAQEVLVRLTRRTNPSSYRSNKRSSTDKALEYAVAAAMEQLHKMVKRSSAPKRRNPSPVPGISVEEVIADVQGEEWANWAYNRAGIMHYR